MFFDHLFDKYFEQVSLSLIPAYKKSLMKIYLREIRRSLESLENHGDQKVFKCLTHRVKTFEENYNLTFKPLVFPENIVRTKIKSELEVEWSGFFKSVSVLIDNHDFYKAIENSFQRYYSGMVKAAEVLARDAQIMVDVQSSYNGAINVGQSKEKLVKNLQFLSSEQITLLFKDFYSKLERLKNDPDNYSEQTVKEIQATRDILAFQIERIISEERELQSEYNNFFLNYRLRVSQQVDPICNELKLFSFRGSKFRSEFIEALIGFEAEHPDNLATVGHILDQQLDSLLQEMRLMQSVEQANEKSRKNIAKFAESNQSQFFQEVIDEAYQGAIRDIGDSIREINSLPALLEHIKTVEKVFRGKVNSLRETEEQYIQLRQDSLKRVKAAPKFSMNLLNLEQDAIEEIFVPHSSFQLGNEQLDTYDDKATRTTIENGIKDGVLFVIAHLGDLKSDPINISKDIDFDDLLNMLMRKIAELRIGNLIGLIPVLVDEKERNDIPYILFFCKEPEKNRTEIVGILEVSQQGKYLYVNKKICILPLPSSVLNNILGSYKEVFRSSSKKVSQLLSDQFLVNKLKLDFQGQLTKEMTQAKKQLRTAYLSHLKEEVFVFLKQDIGSENEFLKSVDNLIIDSLDCLLHGDDEQSITW